MPSVYLDPLGAICLPAGKLAITRVSHLSSFAPSNSRERSCPSSTALPPCRTRSPQWRRDIHENPEILYDVHRTAGVVADKLKAFGCDEVVPGIGRTGVVGVIKGRKGASGKVIGMRADMDALPMTEMTGLPYASKTPGKMHACGHDGHTAMLLGAAKYLCETRNFDGTAIVIFQPAEEGGAGGKAMVDDGLMERWNIQEVYGMHNMPGIPVGQFAIRPGPLLAASDAIFIDVTGKGGHAARPHECIDPVLVASHIVTALQSIVARNVDPLKSGVVSICMFHSGEALNVIPRDGAPRGHRPHADARGARPARAPGGGGGRDDRAAVRRHRQGALRAPLSRDQQPCRARPSSRPRWRRRWRAPTRSTPTRRR